MCDEATSKAIFKNTEKTVLNSIDVAEHAKRRKGLNLIFTGTSLRATAAFIVEDVDRWNELMLRGDHHWRL